MTKILSIVFFLVFVVIAAIHASPVVQQPFEDIAAVELDPSKYNLNLNRVS